MIKLYMFITGLKSVVACELFFFWVIYGQVQDIYIHKESLMALSKKSSLINRDCTDYITVLSFSQEQASTINGRCPWDGATSDIIRDYGCCVQTVRSSTNVGWWTRWEAVGRLSNAVKNTQLDQWPREQAHITSALVI